MSRDTVGPFIKKCGIADKISHKKLIIPGYAAGILGDLEEELPGWQITVGPREAGLIPQLLKSLLGRQKTCSLSEKT